MNVTVLDRKPDRAIQPERSAQSHLGFIDCDVHPYVKCTERLRSVPVQALAGARQTIGNRSRQGLARCSMYPRMSPGVRHAYGQSGQRAAGTRVPTCR